MSATAQAAGMSTDERKAILDAAVANTVSGGWRVESRTDFQAVLVKGKNHSHVLHLILTLITLGLWLLVWIPLAVFGGEKRAVLTVDADGRVATQR